MKKILLANIGNRNLLFNGKLFTDKDFLLKVPTASDDSFRSFTQKVYKKLLHNVCETKVEINIINKILDKKKLQLSKVVLFATDQNFEEKNDQDTLYEAQILKLLIKEKYKLDTEIVVCNFNVTDNDKLLRFYIEYLKSHFQNNSKGSFIICDAGGTAQQKTSLKLAAEFILPQNSFQFLYVSIYGGKIEPVDNYEYRRIISSEQVIALIKRGNYQAAAELYLKETEFDNQFVSLLEFAHYRKSQMLASAVSVYGLYKHKSELPNFYIHYIKNVSVCSENFLSYFGHTQHKRNAHVSACLLSEQLWLAEFYLKNKYFTDFVLIFHIYMENFITHFIRYNSQYVNIATPEKYFEEGKKIVDHLELIYPKTTEYFVANNIKKPVAIGFPLLLLIAKEIAEKQGYKDILQIIKKFMFLNSFINKNERGRTYIDKLRNAIAHDGKGVLLSQLQSCFNDRKQTDPLYRWKEFIAFMKSKMGLDSSNVYELMNQYLEQKIKLQ